MGTTVSKNLVGASSALDSNVIPPVTLVFGVTWGTYLFWANPVPNGRPVTSSILRLYASGAWITRGLTVTAVDVPWDTATVKLGTNPAATGPSVSISAGSLAVASEGYVDVDITPILSAVSAGRVWYGIRIAGPDGTLVTYGTGANGVPGLIDTTPRDFRPYVTTTWLDAIGPPTNLVPSAHDTTFWINTQHPVLSWQGAAGISVQYQIQINDDSTFAGTMEYDTGFVAMPQQTSWDTASVGAVTGSAFTAVSGTNYWWRVRAKSLGGDVSAWSTPSLFTYKAAPTLTLDSPVPPTTHDPTPKLDWHITGGVGGEAQIYFTLAVWEADTGKLVINYFEQTTRTDYQIPANILWFGRLYKYELTVVTNEHRMDAGSVQGYPVKTFNMTITYDGGIPGPDTLVALPDANYPWVEVKWTYTDSTPDSFSVLRNGALVGTYTPAQVSTGVTNEYHIFDFPPNRKQTTWTVIATNAIVGSSDGTDTVTITVRHNFSWLVSPDLLNFVMLGNLDPEKDVPGNTTIVEPLSGKPVVVTQGVSTERGRISARVADKIVPATAAQMLASFYNIRDLYGGRAKLWIHDRIIDVFVYDLVQYERTFNESVVYDIEFSYIETVG